MSSNEPIHIETLHRDKLASRLELSIARLLREHYPAVRLRERVRNHPLLEQTKLCDLLRDPLRYDAFMVQLRGLPQCGALQVTRMREVLAAEHQAAEANSHSALQPLQMAVVSAPPSALAADTASHTAKCTFYPDFVDAVEDVYFRMWRLAQFDRFVYAPSSLPEFVKTPEVLAVELEPGRDLTAYLARVASLRNTLERIDKADGVVLLDGRALETVFLRGGRYAALSQDTVDRQFEMLKALPGFSPVLHSSTPVSVSAKIH